MVHAKVWITSTSTIVGSWNMTLPGIGAVFGRNNIEAGFKLFNAAERLGSLTPLSNPKLIDTVDEETAQRSSHMPWHMIHVEFDWKTHLFKILWNDNTSPGNYTIKLPGVPDKVNLDSSETSIHIQHIDEIVKHKFFELHEKEGVEIPVQNGCIIELNKENRISWRFPTMGDIFSHYLNKTRSPKTGSSALVLTEKTYGNSDVLQIEDNHGESYFLIFRALFLFENELEEVKQKKDLHVYHNLLYSHPGNLLELSERIVDLINDPKAQLSFVHQFLLVKEVERLIDRQEDEYGYLTKSKESLKTWLDAHNDQTKDLIDLYENVIEENWHAKTHR
jgi:hypothetical protein